MIFKLFLDYLTEVAAFKTTIKVWAFQIQDNFDNQFGT